ncbi:MAG: DUF6751 family protein [Oscillospiraceae bacterium]
MYTNTDVTYYAYDDGKYTRTVITGKPYGAFWDEVKASNVVKSGRESADSAVIYVPEYNWPDITPSTSLDLIVRGNCVLTVDSSSNQKASQSLVAIKAAGALTVKSIDSKLYGSLNMQHYKISCG